jgi:uncharacterized membrane protein
VEGTSANAALAVNLALAVGAWRAGAIAASGALAGAAYGACVALGLGLPGYAVLAWFVVVGSGATWVGARRKPPHEPRSARHATANCAVAALVGALAAALADTIESELGVVWGRRAWLPTTWRSCPPGTEGAVSVAGTLLGLAAAAATAGLGALVGLVPAASVPALAAAATAATGLESWLGARWTWSNEALNFVTTASGALLGTMAVVWAS